MYLHKLEKNPKKGISFRIDFVGQGLLQDVKDVKLIYSPGVKNGIDEKMRETQDYEIWVVWKTRKSVVSTSNSMVWLNMSNSFNICAFSPHEVIEQCTGFEEDVICEVIYEG